MVKLGGKDIGLDQGLNLYIGAGAAINGIMWLARPEKVHAKTVTVPSSKAITRIGGAFLANVAASHLVAGLSRSSDRNKQQLKIAAGQYAILTGLGVQQWKQGGNIREDRVKAFALTSAVHTAVCLWRGAYVGGDGTIQPYPR